MSARRKATAPRRLDPESGNDAAQPAQAASACSSSGHLIIDDSDEDDVLPSPTKKRRSKVRKSSADAELESLLEDYSCVLQVQRPVEVKQAPHSLFCLGQVEFTVQPNADLDDRTLESVLRSSCRLFIGCNSERTDCHILLNSDDQWRRCTATTLVAEDLLRMLAHRRSVWLVAANVDSSCIVVDVLLSPCNVVHRLSHPSDSPRTSVNCEIQTLVHHFFGICHSERPREGQRFQRQDIDLLYSRVAAVQSCHQSEGDEGAVEVQHPALQPTLRPYQRDVVRWMLRREQSQAASSTANFLYTPLVDRNGKLLHYNKYAGFFVEEQLDFAVAVRPGGILADEMGLGKTVELLACVLLHPMPASDSTSAGASDTEEYGLSEEDEEEQCVEDLADLAEGTRVECLCGGLDLGKDSEEVVRCPACRAYHHLACTTSDGLRPGEKYLCPHCWVKPDKEKIKVKTTLIVSPSSISFQWLEEIERHQKEDVLRVMEYRGVQSHGFVSPLTFAKHDVVLTTYEVLKKELNFTDLPHASSSDSRLFRNPRKFLPTPCPLTALAWWRVCLDEAQMVEGTATKAAQMALKLAATNRWCITGTPVQKSLHDLYGLLLFLGEEPYDVKLWWNECLLLPYCHGNTEPLVNVLSRCFKRTMKRNVLDQIGVPPQESVFHTLSFCPVEEVFYERQADRCAMLFMEQVRKFPDHTLRIEQLDRHSVGMLLQPLVRLRQACCHPRAVRGAFLPMRTDSLTMEELLTSLIKKTTVECEEAHRRMVSAINGIAGIHIIRDEMREAADAYREVLWSAKDHSKNFKTDRLQQLHALVNLAQLLGACQAPLESEERLASGGGVAACSRWDSSNGEPSVECLRSSQNDVDKGVCVGTDLPASVESSGNGDPGTSSSGVAPNPAAVDGAGCTGASSTEHDSLGAGLALNSEPALGSTECGALEDEARRVCLQGSLTDTAQNVSIEAGLPASGVLDSVEGRVGIGHSATSSPLREGASRSVGLAPTAARSVAEAPKSTFFTRKVSYIPQAPSDDKLNEEAAKLRASYLEGYLTAISAAREQFSLALQAVKELEGKFALPQSRPWWNKLLDTSMQSSRDEWLVGKVKDDLEASRSGVSSASISDQFNTVHGLQYIIDTQLRQLGGARKTLKGAVKSLSSCPSTEDVMLAVDCHLRPTKKKRNKCKYCVVHELFNMYENHLFCFTEDAAHEEAQDKEDALLGTLRRGNWGDSNVEKIIKSLSKHSSFTGEQSLCSDGHVHVQLFSALKKEFRAMRAVYMNIRDFVGALDELEMATVRFEVQLPKPGEEKDKDAPPLPVNVLRPWEVPQQWSKLLYEKELHRNDLKKKLGQLFYLKNLEKAGSHQEGESNPEPCPICRSALGRRWSVMQCGHNFCMDCIKMICSTPSCSRNGSLLCAVCRTSCAHGDVFYVETSRPTQARQSRFALKGSHTTKVGGIVETILEIKADDPSAKALVFSTWPVVINVLKKALTENDVSFISLRPGPTFKNNLALFRHDPSITVLLLPLSLGAKGLNLTEATHVLLVEPILNLGEELQAIGRIHRIGQTRKTYVHRFMVKNTIEERIVDFLKSSQTSRNGLEDHSKMTIEDLKDLFK